MRPLRAGGLVAIVALIALLATPSLVLADAPVATDDSYPAVEDTTLTVAADGVLVNDTDIDLDAMVAVLDTGPSDGGLALDADGGFTYTPDADFSGTEVYADMLLRPMTTAGRAAMGQRIRCRATPVTT